MDLISWILNYNKKEVRKMSFGAFLDAHWADFKAWIENFFNYLRELVDGLVKKGEA